jgi:D-sedoheptulose 7-phosphate isomerase
MSTQTEFAVSAAHADREFARHRWRARLEIGERFFSASAADIAACAAAMADRFFAGATLLVMGTGASATDAQHNSVEYVHPVLPGCRALPALSLSNDIAVVTEGLSSDDRAEVYAHQLRTLGRQGDIALALTRLPLRPATRRGLETAARGGMLTVALVAGGGRVPVPVDHLLQVDAADPLVAQELHLATYHMLWELVHIVLNHRGIAQ